ncbi:MAG TPA: branched-chain amino acid ABC transporter permease [Bacillales bacterium]
MGRGMKKNGLLLLLILAAVAFPLLPLNSYILSVVTLSFIWAIAVYGLNLITGYTGELNLAHAGFFAIGAYSLGILEKAGLGFWLALICACLITMAIGFVIGLISLRLSGHYFAIFTLSMGLIISLVIENWDSLTGGVVGLIGIPDPAPIGPVTFKNNPISTYYLVLLFLIFTIFVFSRIVRSLLGRSFTAIRNSPELAQTLGIPLMRTKVLSFVLSTFFAGLAGGLYAIFIGFLGIQITSITVSFDMLVYLLVGGIGTIAGPVVGALLVTWLTEFLKGWTSHQMIFFGPLLILLVIFFPRGIVGAFRIMWGSRKEKSSRSASTQPKEGRQTNVNGSQKINEDL